MAFNMSICWLASIDRVLLAHWRLCSQSSATLCYYQSSVTLCYNSECYIKFKFIVLQADLDKAIDFLDTIDGDVPHNGELLATSIARNLLCEYSVGTIT